MSGDFALAAEALACWPTQVPATTGGTVARLLATLSDLEHRPERAGTWDLCGLVRQALAEEAAHLGGPISVKVPRRDSWPDRATWEAFGVDVVETAMYYQLRPTEWLPSWLPAGGQFSPIVPVLRGDRRLRDASVAGDPVWAELGFGSTTYVSPGQRAAVRAATLLAPGRTLLVILPTGGGKSMVAHAPALLTGDEGCTTLVVVPTVALAQDQARRALELLGAGQGAATDTTLAYHGGLSEFAKREVRDRLRQGRQRILFASPEAVVRALRPALLAAAKNGALRTIVIDEAHLVSQWGLDFRPEFQALAGVRRQLVDASPEGRSPRTLLLSATVTQEAYTTLKMLFGSPDLDVVAAMHLRPEPDARFVAASNDGERKLLVLEALRFAPRPLILYTSRREDADEWARCLWGLGLYRLGKLHGATPATERDALLQNWAAGEVDVMVATSAFGLGVDKADIRTVIHACVPETLDRYYQEIGRGGRDGRASLALLVHTPDDWRVARSLNRRQAVGLKKGLARWEAMFRTANRPQGQERVVVNLGARHAGVTQDSDANIAWNLRTLVLMARAGLLDLDAVEPLRAANHYDESSPAADAAPEGPERYALTVAVRPRGHDHRDATLWATRVQGVRQELSRASDDQLNKMVCILGGKAQLGEQLTCAYALNFDALTLRPTSMQHPDPYVRAGVLDSIDGRLRSLLPEGRPVLLIGAPTLGGTSTARWRTGLVPALRRLVALGMREIRAPLGWRDLVEYRTLYRYASPRIVFHTDLSERWISTLSVPRLTIIESADALTDALMDVHGSDRPVEVLILPRDLPDPARPDRRALDVHSYLSLDKLAEEID